MAQIVPISTCMYIRSKVGAVNIIIIYLKQILLVFHSEGIAQFFRQKLICPFL